jgi:putative spermidine/putrescine transport system substrate-binding protein
MSTTYSGRVITAKRSGQPLAVVWNGAVAEYDYWIIPKGSPNKKQALEFIKSTVTADAQYAFLSKFAGGPVNTDALQKMSPELLETVPNGPSHVKSVLDQDRSFWNTHGDELDQKFAAWAAK